MRKKINLSTPVQPPQLRSTLLKSTLTIIRVGVLQLAPRMSTSTWQKDISPLENRDKNGRVRPMLKLRLKAKAVSKGIEIQLTFVMRYEAIDDELTALSSSQPISSLRCSLSCCLVRWIQMKNADQGEFRVRLSYTFAKESCESLPKQLTSPLELKFCVISKRYHVLIYPKNCEASKLHRKALSTLCGLVSCLSWKFFAHWWFNNFFIGSLFSASPQFRVRRVNCRARRELQLRSTDKEKLLGIISYSIQEKSESSSYLLCLCSAPESNEFYVSVIRRVSLELFAEKEWWWSDSVPGRNSFSFPILWNSIYFQNAALLAMTTRWHTMQRNSRSPFNSLLIELTPRRTIFGLSNRAFKR